MKNVQEVAGIDVSKLTLDVHLHVLNEHRVFDNTKSGYKLIDSWLKKQGIEPKEVLYCFEQTGWYCLELSFYLNEKKRYYSCVNAIEIKRSIGFRREKTDKADAKAIAHYAWLRREELTPSKPPSRKILDLQRMMAAREQMVKQIVSLKNVYKGMKAIVSSPSTDRTMILLTRNMEYLAKTRDQLEKEMGRLIAEDPKMNRNNELAQSVKGIGPIIAIQMILHTHNFSRFSNARQFNAYCGMVPYKYESGTSIKGRPRSHGISDQKMKSLLTSSAMNARLYDKEIKMYYERKIAEGKHKMIVLNAIRNKLVTRVFSVVKRQTPYVHLAQFSA